jgi:outer membrane biosynthesis protein TonB
MKLEWCLLLVCVGCGGAAADGGGARSTEATGAPKDSAPPTVAATTAAAPEAPPPDDTCSRTPKETCGGADPLSSRGGPSNVSASTASVQGRLPPEVIARVVRAHLGAIRACYDQGLAKSPTLKGTVKIKFIIGTDGSVVNAQDEGSQLPATDVVDCVRSTFRRLSFPKPEGGTVTVVYPLDFSPG